MRTVRMAVVGYGFSASTFHVPIIKTIDGFQIVAVVSSNPQKVQAELPDVHVYSTLGSLLEHEDIEVVIITTPNSLHYPMAQMALDAKKHVVIDKPFVVNLHEGEQLIDFAKRQGKILSVYQNRRWDGDYLTLKSCLERGALGNVYTFESRLDRFRPQVKNRWREQNVPGAGLLYDLGPHLIDQALQLFGLPAFVMADVCEQRAGSNVDDYFHLIFGYDTLRVILHAGSMVIQPGPRFSVHGSEGSFIKYGLDSQEEQLKAGQKPGDDGFGLDDENHYAQLTTLNADNETVTIPVKTLPGSYDRYYREILAAILGVGEVPVLASDALWTIQLIEYALKSNRDRCAVVVDRSLFKRP